jgi:hypothetical protein
MKIFYIVLATLTILLTGCVTDSKKELFATDQSQVQVRSYQTRVFDTTDRQKTLKTVIATLQDLGFVISKADSTVGVVTGEKYANQHSAILTATVQEKGKTQTMVRVNVQQHLKAVEKPEPYQDFFNALGKAMFLTAHEVE